MTNRFRIRTANLQTETQRIPEIVVTVLTSQLYELDHLTRALLLTVATIQSPPHFVIACRPSSLLTPPCQRRRAGQSARFALKNIQVMFQLQYLLHAAVAALVTRHPLALVPDLNLQRHQLYQHTLTAPERRRIPVRSCTHTALLVHYSETPLLELESRCRQRQQVFTFQVHPHANLMLLATNLARRLLAAAPQQVLVQLFPVRELRDRCPVVSTKVAHLAFNAALLVAATRVAKLRFESPVRAKRNESFCLITLLATKDFPYR